MGLAESEREGGISPNVIPFKEMSELGNILSRTGYNLTTLNITKYNMQFRDFSQICDFLKSVGENNFLINRRRFKSRETFLAASCIYNSLYSNKNYNCIGTLKVDDKDFRIVNVNMCNYLNDELTYLEENEIKEIIPENYLIMTLEIANMIGWKYHHDQQKPKRRGSAEINLRDITKDLLEDNPEEEIKFGKIALKQGGVGDEDS